MATPCSTPPGPSGTASSSCSEHVERLYRSLRYLRIDPGLTPAAMVEDHRGGAPPQPAPARAGRRLLGDPARDRAGSTPAIARPSGSPAPTVIVECLPLPLRERAPLFRDGIRVAGALRPPHAARRPERRASRRTTTSTWSCGRPRDRRRATPRRGRSCSTSHGNLAEGLGQQHLPGPHGAALHAARAVRAGRASAGTP